MMHNQDPPQEPVMDPGVPMEAQPGPTPAVHDVSNGLKCRLDLNEARGVLTSMSLTSVPFGRYLLVMRTECDVLIGGEPYVALVLWLNLETGKFMARIWNQTVMTGDAFSLEKFTEACQTHFSQGRPCLGYPEDEQEQVDAEYLTSQTPVPRRISKMCHKTLGSEVGATAHSCQECLKLRDCKQFDPNDVAANCKVELLSDNEDSYDLPYDEPAYEPSSKKRKFKYKKEDLEDDDFDPSYEPSYDLGCNSIHLKNQTST